MLRILILVTLSLSPFTESLDPSPPDVRSDPIKSNAAPVRSSSPSTSPLSEKIRIKVESGGYRPYSLFLFQDSARLQISEDLGLLSIVQAYYVIVETVNGNNLSTYDHTITYSQSIIKNLPYYTAAEILPNKSETSRVVSFRFTNEDPSTTPSDSPTGSPYVNVPLRRDRRYRIVLVWTLTDNSSYVKAVDILDLTGRSPSNPTGDFIKLLIYFFLGLIVILLIVIAVLIYYLRESEIDVRWQDVFMIWSKRHRSSLFKDKNRLYKPYSGSNRSNKASNKYLPGDKLRNPIHSNSYINMAVEHHYIDLPSLVSSLADPKSKSTLSTEFNSIPFIQMPSIDGTKAENRKKNRYVYLPAYDFNRVKLSLDEDEKQANDQLIDTESTDHGDEEGPKIPSIVPMKPTDYINASFIDGYSKAQSYISTQGPLTWTFDDFWKMIWQQDCSQIVMLTGIFENGRIKCNQYWPNDGETICYGKVEVAHSFTDTSRPEYVIRLLKVSKGDARRDVYHYHYTNWPDHGAPEDPQPLLNLMEIVDLHNDSLPSEGPLVVHCSAGVGRTGTYILIDLMKRMFEQEKRFDVLGQLYSLRKQRTHMVETEDQYYFIHQSLAHHFTRKGQTEQEATTNGEAKRKVNGTTNNVPLIRIDSEEKTT